MKTSELKVKLTLKDGITTGWITLYPLYSKDEYTPDGELILIGYQPDKKEIITLPASEHDRIALFEWDWTATEKHNRMADGWYKDEIFQRLGSGRHTLTLPGRPRGAEAPWDLVIDMGPEPTSNTTENFMEKATIKAKVEITPIWN